MKSKYFNRKITVNGIPFDSQKEYKRFCELSLLQRAGVITDLERQVKFVLIPAQYETVPTGEYYKRGEKKGQPKFKDVCVEQSLVYNADFVYTRARICAKNLVPLYKVCVAWYNKSITRKERTYDQRGKISLDFAREGT